MEQLLQNFYVKGRPGRKARKLNPDDFIELPEIFKTEVLKHPLRAIAIMAKENILKYGGE